MAKEVIKRDGSKEPFDPEKIKGSIRKAAVSAGLEEGRINEIVETVSAKAIESCEEMDEVSSTQIREKVLALLDETENSVSKAWRDYDEKYKG